MTVAVLDRPEVQHALRRELARRELAEFCALMDPDRRDGVPQPVGV